MATGRLLQSSTWTSSLLVGGWCLGVGTCLIVAFSDPQRDLLHPAVLASAVVTVAWMVAAWWLMIVRCCTDGLIRLTWTLGLLMLLLHLVLSFWLAHGWSHESAVEHVREVGGFGGGILVSYLFTLVWMADVIWWWTSPLARANRPTWLGWTIQGFLAFVVLNATVVFGAAERRAWYCGVLGVLVASWTWSRHERARGMK